MSETRKLCEACNCELPGDVLHDLCPRCLLRVAYDETGARNLHVRCPHCRNPVDIVDDSPLAELSCPSCGSNFSMVSDTETTPRRVERESLGRFELVERVGIGAFGAVWKARDTELDRIVAVKIPRKAFLSVDEMEMFVREARAAAQIKHRNVVRVHEVGREDDLVYIVSDYVDGVTLADWLTAKRPTAREAAQLCRTIARALHDAHESGVVHRDLKPSNVLIDASGEPYVTDFGLAKREAGEITMTMEGVVLGTPAYLSPEQATGRAHDADRRSDVYSLGVMLFELLTGERPFRGSTRMLLRQVAHEEAPQPRKLNAAVPRDVETICLRCLEKEPSKRYESCAQLEAELHRFLTGEPILARPITQLHRTWRWYRRHAPFIAGAYTVFTFALYLIMTLVMVSVVQFIITRPTATMLASSLALSAISMTFGALGAWAGVATFRGSRRALVGSAVVFGVLSVVCTWGLYWAIQVARAMSDDAISSVLALKPQSLDGTGPYVRNSVIGYAVLGSIWIFMGLALQIYALRRSDPIGDTDIGSASGPFDQSRDGGDFMRTTATSHNPNAV